MSTAILEFLLDFLTELEQIVPPPAGCHHAILRSQYGDEVIGWEDRLTAQVNVEGKFYAFFLDADDFENPHKLADVIAFMLRTNKGSAQVSDIMGQFTMAQVNVGRASNRNTE